MTDTRTGIQRIVDERARQIAKEGWTPEHDDEHVEGELALVGALYATPEFEDKWPSTWCKDWDKRILPEYRNSLLPTAERIRELEKAGALIAAEIDRLLRKRRGLTMGSDLHEDRAEVERLRDELRKLIVENERLIQTVVPPSQCEPVEQGIRYPNLFAAARKTMAYALATDPGLFESYEANVAMLLSDRYGFRVPKIRNQAAKDILKLIFEG
jgi:hypothetical protein